jgi:hypothetical protein
MGSENKDVDVLCVGHASCDLLFSISQHPSEDEKIFADGFIACGGGPAANAAVAVSRLGYINRPISFRTRPMRIFLHIRCQVIEKSFSPALSFSG